MSEFQLSDVVEVQVTEDGAVVNRYLAKGWVLISAGFVNSHEEYGAHHTFAIGRPSNIEPDAPKGEVSNVTMGLLD